MAYVDNNGRVIGLTGQQTGVLITKLAPSLAAIPVVGIFAAAGAELVGAVLTLFGNKYDASTGVRWLTQYYEKYVLGLPTRSDNTVDANNIGKAQAWFYYVLGVPVYDKYRLGALMGSDPDNGTYLHWTDEQKVQDYLKYAETDGIDPAVVMQAVQIAKKMRWSDPPGSWAGFTPAPSLIDTTATESTQPGGSTTTNVNNTQTDNRKRNIVLGALAIAALILFSDAD